MIKIFGSNIKFCNSRVGTKLVSLFAIVFCSALSSLFFSTLISSPASATGYSINMTTDTAIDVVTTGGSSTIDTSEINVVTNCHAGYNLTLSTSVSDNNLYLSGDSTNNTADTFITPSNGTTSLDQSTNSWGYLLSNSTPTTSSTFLPVPGSSSASAVLKTPAGTASETDIDDTFNIYYGANVSSTLYSGIYQMTGANNTNGSLLYYLTADPSCVSALDVTFNKNMDGQGGESDPGATVANFPTSSENVLDPVANTLTLSSKTPTRTDYVFKEWNTEADGTGSYYYPGAAINIGTGVNPNHTNATGPNGSNLDSLNGNVTLYAIWIEACAEATICYDGNHANGGTMDDEAATNNSNIALIASNFDRSGYGFAGWNTKPDGSGTQYGPNQTIKMVSSGGLNLFARWIKSTGTLQTWNGASNMNTGDITALTDNRDNEVYTVAKLVDNNVWIVENLRLVPNTANINAGNTNNPTTTFINAAPSSSSKTDQCSNDDWECDDQINFYTGNMNRSATQSPTGNTLSKAWYSYGTMYNWYTATAGNGKYDIDATGGPNENGTVAGDICPAGWHLPTGTSSGEYNALTTAVGGTGSSGAATLRKYPNNFIFSGDYNPKTVIPDGRGTQGRLWHSTAATNDQSYRMGYNATKITPINTYNKWDNFAVRCIYHGGTTPRHNLAVTLNDPNITSITFTNSTYGTETATSQNSTVPLAEGATYTITANLTTGYELVSWTTGQNATIGNVNENPTTIVITDDTTLALTTQAIPTYQVTVNLDAGTTSMSFTSANYPTINVVNNNGNGDGTETATVSLRRGVEYTITGAFDTANDYAFDSWTTTGSSTIGSTSANPTTFTITGTATISLTSTAPTKAILSTDVFRHIIDNNGDFRTVHSLSEEKLAESSIISSNNSEFPIYYYNDFENDIGYIYTEANKIALESCASELFTYSNITNIDFASEWDTSEVTDMSYLFYASAITNIDGAINWNTSNVEDMHYIFQDATSLTNIDGAINWDTSNVKNVHYMFENTASLANIDGAINWNTSNITDMQDMFSNTTSLTNIDGAINWDTSNVTNMQDMFYNATSLTNIDGAVNWDTSNVTDMASMFNGASSLTNIDGAVNWDTSNVTDMASMFMLATSLTNIDALTNWNTSSVIYMSSMFEDATALANIDGARNWDTRSVTNMNSMFSYDHSLTNIDGTRNWDTSIVTDMGKMFRGAPLANIDALTDWDTSNVRHMDHMFSGATLTDASSIDNWDIRNVSATSGSSSMWSNEFYQMFQEVGGSSTSEYHPNFTQRSGTWDRFGTFIPDDTTIHPNVTVTIDFDSHISSVEIGENTVSTSGSTVSLSRGYPYEITANLASGYELTLWNPGNHGVISPSRLTLNTKDEDATIFTPTDDTTLSATSQVIPNDITTTVNMDSNVNKVSFCNNKYNTYNSNTDTYDCASTSTNGGTVTLKQGATYRVTAATKSGYEVTSYTATGATITSTAGAHTDFTPSGTSSITVTSATKASTHTVTVNMDSNVSYVTFTNSDWPTRVAIRNGSTVDLRNNTQYTVTAYAKDGYELASWFTTAGGTLGSTTTNPTSYTTTGTATLSVTSQQSIETMQGFAAGTTSTTCSSMSIGDTLTLTDSRDGASYTVGKLADNKCWMLDNLTLDLVADKDKLDASNTNASNTTLNYLKNGGGSSPYTGTAVAYGSNTYDAPQIAVSGTCYDAYCVNDPENGQWRSSSVTQETINGVTSITQGKIGTYYNYCAASAGSYCYDTSSSLTSDASEDICPAGWRLPTGGSNGEFKNLYSQYSSGSPSQEAAFQTAFNTPLSGEYLSGKAQNQGSYGWFWSSTHCGGGTAYMFGLGVGSGYVGSVENDNRHFGHTIRCILSN